jgi:hypothetical protein
LSGKRHHEGPRRVNVKPLKSSESGIHHPMYRINRLLMSSVIKNISIGQKKTAASLPYSRNWTHVLLIIPQQMREFKHKVKKIAMKMPDPTSQRNE